jgi:hypothetical protein
MTIITKSEKQLIEITLETKRVSDFDNSKDSYASIWINCGYGSNYDPLDFKFDIDNETLEKVMNVIRENLPKDKTAEDFAEQGF